MTSERVSDVAFLQRRIIRLTTAGVSLLRRYVSFGDVLANFENSMSFPFARRRFRTQIVFGHFVHSLPTVDRNQPDCDPSIFINIPKLPALQHWSLHPDATPIRFGA